MMRSVLIAIFIYFSLTACNLGIAQQIEEQDIPVTQMTSTPIENIDDTDFSEEVVEHIRAIYHRGQTVGNRANIFSKVGDSITVSRSFLYPFGIGRYNIDEYPYLETIIHAYSQNNAHIGNSFINQSLAAGEGWSARPVLNPEFANEGYCAPGEMPLSCEYRLVRPSIAIIMFGTNDSGYRTAESFAQDMQTIIDHTIETGIIPIISTIPNRPDVAQQVIRFNDVIRQLALENNIPLIELYNVTVTLPNHGLTSDNVHLSSPPAGIQATGSFDTVNLQYGYVMRNFVTLNVLDAVHRVIND